MTHLDYLIIAAYFAFTLGVGLVFQRRAGRSLSEYFLSGRSLPWWLAGTSMVATTFAADTPLAVTGLVARHGIAGNWLWWNLAASHVLATFFLARLWRRAGVLTDIELVDLRYSGRPARFLRGFRGLWEGVVVNCIVMGWVTLAMVKILGVLFDLDALVETLGLSDWIDGRWLAILLCLAVAVAYTGMSGFWGVVVTDGAQFLLAMSAAVILAVLAARQLGGLGGLEERLVTQYGSARASGYLAFVPRLGGSLMPVSTFVAYVAVNWWATRQSDSGSYLAQRLLATRNEGESFLAALWFTVAHYVLRPWPWIVVALASLVLFPGLEDPELGYPMAALHILPSGLLGVMVASLLAAFMSTIDSHLHWGSSLLVNDVYRPFLRPDASEEHYVRVSRGLVVALMVGGGGVAYLMGSIVGAWELLFGMTAGVGGVYISRWLWWRVSAWSEIAAWIASAAIYLPLQLLAPEMLFGPRLMITAGGATAVWVIVTLCTPPTEEAKLVAFYQRVRPGSPGWRRVAARAGVTSEPIGWSDLADWLLGLVFIYAALFGVGSLLLRGPAPAAAWLAVAVTAAALIYRNALRRQRRPPAPPTA